MTGSLLPQNEKEGRIIVQKVEEKKKRKKIQFRMDAHHECQGTANDFYLHKNDTVVPQSPDSNTADWTQNAAKFALDYTFGFITKFPELAWGFLST